MSTTALTGLRDYLCDSLDTADMMWLSVQLADYARRLQEEELMPTSPKRFTMDEINAMLDEAERQVKTGKVVSNEDVFRKWDERKATRKAISNEQLTVTV
ncbi:MAG: hypothetical protein K6F33_15585 [Bacteroidales bacterium]|nr:hypothetical protein [Bacteroidales bacterium]